MKNNLIIDSFFSLYIAQSDLFFDVESIKNYCLDFAKNNVGTQKSNRYGWQSGNHNFPNSMKYLTDTFENAGQSLFEQLEGSPEFKIEMDNIWININQLGSYNISHVHPNTFLSGVYYVQTPENCGRINFTHTCEHIEYDWKSYYFKHNSANSFISRFLDVKENRLYIFPSWAKHSVEPNRNEIPRISLSFNLKLVKNV